MRYFLASGLLCWMLASDALAQGGFVEGLFRTIAEAQLERDQRGRLNPADVGLGRVVPPPQIQDNRVQTPRVDVRRVNPGPSTNFTPDRNTATPTWQTLQRTLDSINANLQREASANANLRQLVPDAYRVAAQVQSLAGWAAARRDDQVSASYAAFDQDYRSMSYAVRSAFGVSDQTRQLVREGDRLVARLSNLYGTEPQWDKRRFDDIVLTSETLMRTVLDDLELISLPSGDRRTITHDLRLLTQRLVEIRREARTMSYSDAAETFNRFTAEVAPLASSLRQLRDAHIDRRLDRLAELADETYSLLWMQAPVTAGSLIQSATRLEAASHDLRGALSGSVLRDLDRDRRRRAEDLARDVDNLSHELVDRIGQDRSGRSSADLIRQISSAAVELERLVRYLPGPHHSPLALVLADVDAISRVTGTPATAGGDIRSLLPAAATLEGTAEALRNELQRIERYLQPASYRGDMRRASDELYRASRDVHEAVADRRDFNSVRQRAMKLIEPWRILSAGIDTIRRNGARESQARTIDQYRNAMLPAIGDMAAILGL